MAPPPERRFSLGQAATATVYVDVLLAILSIASIPYLVSKLGTEAYGVIGVVLILASQLGVLNFGISSAATRTIAEHRASDDRSQQLAAFYATLIVGGALGALVALAFVLIAPWAWANLFKASAPIVQQAISAVPAAAVIAGSQGPLSTFYALLLGQERFVEVSAFRVVYGTFRVGTSVAVAGITRDVAWVLAIQALVDALAVLSAAAISLRGQSGAASRGAVVRATRSLVGVALPFVAAGILVGLLADVEKLAIAIARSVEDFTYYTVTYNAALRLTTVANAIAMVLSPRLAYVGAQGQRELAVTLTRQASRLVVGGMFALLAPLIMVTPELLEAWLGHDFSVRSTRPTRLVLLGLLVNTSVYPLFAATRARARPVAVAGLYAIELPLHLALVYIFVTFWGITGAAAAWAVRVTGDAIGQRILTRRALGGPIGGMAETAVPFGILALFVIACESIPTAPMPVRLAVGAGTGAFVLTRLYSREDWALVRRSLFPLVTGKSR